MKRLGPRTSGAAFALMRLLPWLPAGARALLGAALGELLWRLVPARRHVTRVNLARCFPELPRAERERLGRAHFRAFCIGFLDHALLWWAPRARIERLVRIEGLEHLRALGGAPAILFVPHFVGLDAGFTRLACEIDTVAMHTRNRDARYAALLALGRTRFGNQKMVSRQQGVRAAIAGMREGRPLYYLPDQDFGARDALFVPFFGVPAATVPGLARIARITGARVLPCVTRRLSAGRGYVMRIEPPWPDYPGADALADTRRMNAYIERRVNEMPEQYLWMHRRFKTRPPGEPDFYART